MKRRDLLGRVAGVAGAGVLAGCLNTSNPGGSDDGDGGDGGGDPTPSIVDRRIETTGTDCKSGEDEGATVDFDGDVVRVTGTLSASDPCHRAKLREAGYDADADHLSVSVEAVEDESAGMCIECVGVVEYEAEIEFSGGLPGEVSVLHGDRTVTTGSR